MEKQFISVMDVWRKDVDIPDIISAVEEKGVYHFDRYGRYKKSDPASCLNGLDFMWGWKLGENGGPVIHPDTNEVMYDPSLQLDDFGWYAEDLPDFGDASGKPKVLPQSKRTENNLLRVIAALCDKLELDWRKCSAADFMRLADLSGEGVMSDDTARKYLKRMRDVVD